MLKLYINAKKNEICYSSKGPGAKISCFSIERFLYSILTDEWLILTHNKTQLYATTLFYYGVKHVYPHADIYNI